MKKNGNILGFWLLVFKNLIRASLGLLMSGSAVAQQGLSGLSAHIALRDAWASAGISVKNISIGESAIDGRPVTLVFTPLPDSKQDYGVGSASLLFATAYQRLKSPKAGYCDQDLNENNSNSTGVEYISISCLLKEAPRKISMDNGIICKLFGSGTCNGLASFNLIGRSIFWGASAFFGFGFEIGAESRLVDSKEVTVNGKVNLPGGVWIVWLYKWPRMDSGTDLLATRIDDGLLDRLIVYTSSLIQSVGNITQDLGQTPINGILCDANGVKGVDWAKRPTAENQIIARLVVSHGRTVEMRQAPDDSSKYGWHTEMIYATSGLWIGLSADKSPVAATTAQQIADFAIPVYNSKSNYSSCINNTYLMGLLRLSQNGDGNNAFIMGLYPLLKLGIDQSSRSLFGDN